MEFPAELEAIDGSKSLFDWFGYWPSFHDAEITRLHLNRNGTSSLAVRTWNRTKEVDERGYYISTKHVLVEFLLSEIADLELYQFSNQNVISGVTVEVITGQSGDRFYRLSMWPCYGLAGHLNAKQVRINLLPDEPPENGSP
jgi:hypothetical protein